MKNVLMLSISLIASCTSMKSAFAAQKRCVVTRASGMLDIYSPPELSIIQLDPENPPTGYWGFDDNGGIGAYFPLPGPLTLKNKQERRDGWHTDYSAVGPKGKFSVGIVSKYDKTIFPPAPLGVQIWIDASTRFYGRGHLLIECVN